MIELLMGGQGRDGGGCWFMIELLMGGQGRDGGDVAL